MTGYADSRTRRTALSSLWRAVKGISGNVAVLIPIPFLSALAILLIACGKKMAADSVARAWMRLLRGAHGITYMVHGDQQLANISRAIIVSNHQSFLDIILLSLILPHRCIFVSKKKLGNIPVWGTALRALGHILVDPDGAYKGGALVKNVKRSLKEADEVFIVIFPEGIRTSNGTIGPFRSGFVVLAQQCDLPVLPIAIEGAYEVLPMGSYMPRQGMIQIRVLDAVKAPDGRGQRQRFSEEVRKLICDAFEHSKNTAAELN